MKCLEGFIIIVLLSILLICASAGAWDIFQNLF